MNVWWAQASSTASSCLTSLLAMVSFVHLAACSPSANQGPSGPVRFSWNRTDSDFGTLGIVEFDGRIGKDCLQNTPRMYSPEISPPPMLEAFIPSRVFVLSINLLSR